MFLYVFRSDSLMEDRSPPSPVVVQYSQSCDLELHEPIRRELVDDVISSQQDQEEAVVDAEAIQRSMELSQRLSPEAISEFYFLLYKCSIASFPFFHYNRVLQLGNEAKMCPC